MSGFQRKQPMSAQLAETVMTFANAHPQQKIQLFVSDSAFLVTLKDAREKVPADFVGEYNFRSDEDQVARDIRAHWRGE